jgi:hypothetical protein
MPPGNVPPRPQTKMPAAALVWLAAAVLVALPKSSTMLFAMTTLSTGLM